MTSKPPVKKILTLKTPEYEVTIRDKSLKDLLAELPDLIAAYGEDARYRTDAYMDQYGGDHIFVKDYIEYTREETDAELANRLLAEKQQADSLAFREKQELERLKKKYDRP